eukprot:m.356466 g.356466  ORF g.356466 m.356466 type:complete len:55 (+) comp16605_c0_seq13:4215-4379(+)
MLRHTAAATRQYRRYRGVVVIKRCVPPVDRVVIVCNRSRGAPSPAAESTCLLFP